MIWMIFGGNPMTLETPFFCDCNYMAIWFAMVWHMDTYIYIYTLRTKTRRNLRVWKIPELFWQNPGYFNPFWKYGLGTGQVRVSTG
jgi:hypothetical protein